MYDDDPSDLDASQLPKLVTEEELYPDGWADPGKARSSFRQFDFDIEMYLFVSKLLELRNEYTAVVGGTRHHLLEGHSWLVRLVSDAVLEQLLAHDIIKRPKLFSEGEYVEREQIARRSYYEVGPAVADLLDYTAIHGIDRHPDNGSTIRRGDPNEGLIHRIGVAYGAELLRAKGYNVYTYYQLDENNILDITAFDGDLEHVAEVETKYDNTNHIRNDGLKLGQCPAMSHWICPTREICNKILSQLIKTNLIYPTSSTSGFPDTLALKTSRERLQEISSSNRWDTTRCESSPARYVDSYDGIRRRLGDLDQEVAATHG